MPTFDPFGIQGELDHATPPLTKLGRITATIQLNKPRADEVLDEMVGGRTLNVYSHLFTNNDDAAAAAIDDALTK